MATIRKRGRAWNAQVRRTNQPTLSRSFPSKAEATQWARTIEARADEIQSSRRSPPFAGLTVRDLLRRYRDTVVVNKRGKKQERSKIEIILRHPLANAALDAST